MTVERYVPYPELRRMISAGNQLLVDYEPATLLSVPVPRIREGRLQECVFMTDLNSLSPDHGTIARPYAFIVLDSARQAIVEFARCSERDFVSTARYPLDQPISNLLPLSMTTEELKATLRKLYEAYEAVRLGFLQGLTAPFAEPLRGARDSYAELFFKTIRIGQYPFLHALNPAFFQWMDMSAQMEAVMGPGNPPPTSTPADKGVAAGLRELRDLFELKIQNDEYKNQLFDGLHRELQSYRNGLNERPLETFATDIILLLDDMERKRALREAGGEAAQTTLETELADASDELLDSLFRAGIEPYTVEGNSVDTKRQRIVGYVDTEDASLVNTVAARRGKGYCKGEKRLRPELITIYRLEKGRN